MIFTFYFYKTIIILKIQILMNISYNYNVPYLILHSLFNTSLSIFF